MSDPQPVVKNEKDLGFAIALAQSLTEPMNIEKDAANFFFKRFLKHTLTMEKFSKKMLMRFQRMLESIVREEIKPSLEQFEFLLQISWLFAANLNRQKSLPKDLWRLTFPVIHAMLEFCAFIIQYLSKQIVGFQKKSEEQTKEKKLENCLTYLHRVLKSLYQQSSGALESNEELEKLRTEIQESLKNPEALQSLKIPPIELKEIDGFLNAHEVIDMDKILEFSMILKIGEDSELFSQILSSQINDFLLKKEGFLDSIEELLRNSLQISSFPNQLYQDLLTWMLNLEKVKEELKLVLALKFSNKVLSEPKILSRKESILEWTINFIQQTTQIPAIFKVKFYLSLLKETIKHLAKIYTIDNDNMITLEICDLIFFNISQLNFDSNHLNRLEVNYYLEFLENIYQIFLIIKQEKNLSITDPQNQATKQDPKEGKDQVNNSMKSEEILNQSGEQMLEISEISSVVGMESEMKDQTKDGLNLKNMLLSEYNISKEEKPNKSKMNVLDEYSFDDFQGSLIKRDVNISKTDMNAGVAILEKSRNQIEKLNGILKNVKRVFEKFLKEDDFLEQIQKALDKKLFRKFLELIEECLMDQIFRRLAESLSEILSMILGKNLAFEKGFFNDFLLYLSGNLTEAGFNRPFNFPLIFTILAQVLKETMVKRPGVYEENLGNLLEGLLSFYLCSEKEGSQCREYHLFLFVSLLRGVSEEKRLRIIERLVSFMEKQLKTAKSSQFFESANGYLAILTDGIALNFGQKSLSLNFNGLLLDLITKRVDLEKPTKFGDSLACYFPQSLDPLSTKSSSAIVYPQGFLKALINLKKLIAENMAKFEAFCPQKHRFYLLLKSLDELSFQDQFEFGFVFERLAWLEACNSLWRPDLTLVKLQEVFKEFSLLYDNPNNQSPDVQRALKLESGLHLLLIKINSLFSTVKRVELPTLLTPELAHSSYMITKTLNQEIQKETNNFLNILITTYNEEELLNLKEFNSDFGLFFLATHNFARLTELDLFPTFSKVFQNDKLKSLLKTYCRFDQEIKTLAQNFTERMVASLKKHDVIGFFALQTQLYAHSLELLNNETLLLDNRKKQELELQNSSNRLIFLMLLMNEMLNFNQKLLSANQAKGSPFSKLQNLDLWFLELQYLQNKGFSKDGYLRHVFEEDLEEKRLQELHSLLLFSQKFKVFFCCANAFSRLVSKLSEKPQILLRIEKIFRKVLLSLLDKELINEANCQTFAIGLIKENPSFWNTIFEPKLSAFLMSSLINCPKPEADNALENLLIALVNYPLKRPKIKKDSQSIRNVTSKLSRKGVFPILRLLRLLTKPFDNIKPAGVAGKSTTEASTENKPKVVKTEKKKAAIEKKKDKLVAEKKKQHLKEGLDQPLRKKEKKRGGLERKKPADKGDENLTKAITEQGLFKPDALVRMSEVLGLKLRSFFLASQETILPSFLSRILTLASPEPESRGLFDKMEVEKSPANDEELELENSGVSVSFEQKTGEGSEDLVEAVNTMSFKELLGFFRSLLVIEPELKEFPELMFRTFGVFLVENLLCNEPMRPGQIDKWTDFLNFALLKTRNLDKSFLTIFIQKVLDLLLQEQDPVAKPQADLTPFLFLLTQLLKFESGNAEASNSMLIEDSKGILSPILEEKPSRKNSMTNLQEKMLGELFPQMPKDIQNESCTYTQNLRRKEKFISQHYYQCYTCDLRDGKGCCTVCAYKCHIGHQVVYCRKAEFFCDCGSGSSCLCIRSADIKEDFQSRLPKFQPKLEKPKNNAFLDLSIGSEKNIASLNMGGILPKEPSEIVEKFEKVETGNNLEFLAEEPLGEKYIWMEASEEEKPRIEESSSESEEREFQLIEENNPESSQTRFLKIKSLMQKLQGIDPNISISGLLGDRSKDLGLFGGLLRKTLKREAQMEKDSQNIIKPSNVEPEKQQPEAMIDESLNISYAPVLEDDGRSVDSNNTSMVMESTNLLLFKKNPTNQKLGSPLSQQNKALLISLNEPLKAEHFLRVLLEKQDKMQLDFLGFLGKQLQQALEKLIAGFSSQKPLKQIENNQQIIGRAPIDWSFKFAPKMDHVLESKNALIAKTFSSGLFECKSKENVIMNDKRMVQYLVITNPPNRSPFEYIASKGLVIIAENDRFSVFEKSALLTGIFEAWNPAYVNKPGLKSTQYFYQYENSPDPSSQIGWANENAGPLKPVFKSPSLGYPIISLLYASVESTANQMLIAVVGLNILNVVYLDKSFNLLKKLPYENKIPQDYIIKVLFLPNAEHFLAVLTLRSLKILNLQAESGNHPQTLVRFTLLDQTLFKDFAFMECQSNPKEKRLFVASNDGNLYTHILNVDELAGLNEEELILVENIFFSPESKPNGKTITLVSYFPQSQLLFCGFDDGNSIAGKFSEKELELINITKIKPGDVGGNKGVFEPFLQRQGQLLGQIREVVVDEDQAKYIGVLKKGNMSFAVSIKLTKNSVIYQPLLPPNPSISIKSEGICLVPYYEKNLVLVLKALEDGTMHVFLSPVDESINLKGLRSVVEEKLPPILKKRERVPVPENRVHTNEFKDSELEGFVHDHYSIESISQLVPCTIFIDFPERFQNLNNKIDLNSVVLLDDFQSLLPPNARNFKSIANILKEPPSIMKGDKPILSLGLGFSTKDWVVCGMRVRIGCGDRSCTEFKLRVFERDHLVPIEKGKSLEAGNIVDVGLTEPEILHAYLQNQLEFELLTNGNKPLSVSFFGVELYGCSSAEFNIKQKINVLGQILRLNLKETESATGNKLFNEKNFKSIQTALLNSKVLANNLDMTVKADFLRNEIKSQFNVKIINLMDILALFTVWLKGTRKSQPGAEGFLLESLKHLLLEEKIDKYLKSAIKRLIRALLSIQERGLDYEGFKDLARLEHVDHEFHQPRLNAERVIALYQLLSKIWTKRCANILLLFSKYPEFIKESQAFLLNILKSHSKDIEDTVFEALAGKTFKLLFLYYQFLRNQLLARNKSGNKKPVDFEVYFRLVWELFEAADLEHRAKLIRIFIEGMKTEILTYSEEALSSPIVVNLPRDVFEPNVVNQNNSATMELEKTEENEEDLMNLAIELSLKDPSAIMRPPEKERVPCEVWTFEIFSDLFEGIMRKIEEIPKAGFEELAGCFYYLLYQTVNLPLNYLMNKLIASSFSAKLDKYLTRIYEQIFQSLKEISNTQDQRPILCQINFVVNFLKYLNKSPTNVTEEKTNYKDRALMMRAETPIKRKHSNSIEQTLIPNPMKQDIRNKFLNALKAVETSRGNFFVLILKTLEELHTSFVNNKGSLRFEFNQGVFCETFKKPTQDPNPRFLNDKSFAENWKAVFRRSESLKKGTGLFYSLDQSLYNSLIGLMLNFLNLGYKDFEEKPWMDFICRSLIRPPTYCFAINNLKKVRNIIYKEQNGHQESFDQEIYQLKFEFLSKIYEASSNFRKPLTYDQLQFLLRTLNTLSRHSSKRPQVWSNFNSNLKQQMLKILIETFPLNINEITENCLHLLAAYLTPLQLEEKASKLLSKGSKDYEELINRIIDNGLSIECKPWFQEMAAAFDFVSAHIFLDSNSKSLRMNSLKFLIALWFAGKSEERIVILNKMLVLSKNLMTYGNNVEHYLLFINFLGCFLKTAPESQELRDILTQIYWQLTRSFIELKNALKHHKNFEIYRDLYEFLYDFNETTGKPRKMHYYFEMNGCLKCYELMNSPYHELKLTEITETKPANLLPSNPMGVNYQDFKFDSFKYSEKKIKFNENVKFTGNSIIAKLNNTYELDSITVVILENYKIKKAVKSISISINNRIINDILDLKNLKSEWKFVKSQVFDEKTASGSRKNVKINFSIPVTARNLKIEFFMSQLKGESMFGSCDVCGSALLEDKFLGTFCLTCKERNREKQCPCCYNIIYEKNDSIFCVPDCGYCKFFDYEVLVSARIGSKIEKIESSKARDDCTKTVSKILSQINDDSRSLFKKRQSLEEMIKLFRSGEMNPDHTTAASNTNTIPQQIDSGLLMPKRPGHPAQTLKSSQSSLIQEIARIYLKDINGMYEQIMKNVTSVIVSRKALFLYARNEGDSVESNLSLFEKCTSNPCFGCNMNYLSHLLRFFSRSNNGIAEVSSGLVFQPEGLLHALTETIVDQKIFNEMRNKARKAIVHLLGNNQKSVGFMEEIIDKQENMYVGMIIEIIRKIKEKIFINQINESLKRKGQPSAEIIEQEFLLTIYKKGVQKILSSLPQILQDAQKDSNIAQKCLLPVLTFIQQELSYSDLKEIIKNFMRNKEQDFKDLTKLAPEPMEEEKEPAAKDLKEKKPTNAKSNFYEEVLTNFKHSLGVDVKKALIFDALVQKIIDKPDNNYPESIPVKVHKTVHTTVLIEKNWVSETLKMTNFQNIHAIICSVLKDMFQSNNKLVLMLLLKSLPKLIPNELESQSFFELFKTLLKKYLNPENKAIEPSFLVYLLEHLISAVDQELQTFRLPQFAQNELYLMNIDLGFGLNETLELIFALVKYETKPFNILKRKSPDFLKFIIRDLLVVRRLSSIKNQQFCNLDCNLVSLFNEFHSEDPSDKRVMLKELSLALFRHQKDLLAEIFLCEQMVTLIEPVKKKYSVLLILEKKRTQEDYIKGSMKSNPYSADDIGTTFKNIRSKLYRDLELKFDENEPFFELLVNDQIISVDLPISLVYEKVWIPHIMNVRGLEEGSEIPKDIQPMKIVYRIAGFEGEATENRIDRLNEDDQQNKDPEKKYEIAKTLIEAMPNQPNVTCISLLLARMKVLNSTNESILIVGKLLLSISQVSSIRDKIIESNGVGILLNALLNRFSKAQSPENDQIIELLIGILENAVISTEKIDSSDKMQLENEGEEDESISYLNLCFKKLEELNQQTPKPEKTITILTRILPFLAKDYLQSNISIIGRYINFLDFKQLEPTGEMEKFIGIMEVLPKKFTVLRDLCLKYGVFDKIVAFFNEVIPNEAEINHNILQDYQKPMALALKMVKGMVLNHKPNQLVLYQSRLVSKIHKLSHTSIKIKEIGKIAESIMEYLLQSDKQEIDPQVLDFVKQMVDEERQQKKRLADQKKQELLKAMKQGNKFLNEEKEKKMEIEEEEKGVKCIVCHEGYKINPKNILGVYLFSKAHRIADEKTFTSELLVKEVNGIGSVTHFNCIHLKCHNAAAKAELTMKKPKKEWEGAIIRNSHTKCNNWFPIRGEGIQSGEYESAVLKYFVSIEPLMRSEGQSQSWLVLNDLKNLMMKFGKQESLSKESKGGSYEHNAKIIPFYLQMIIFLVNKEDPNKWKEYHECFNKLTQNKIVDLTPDHVYLCLTMSLLLLNSKESIIKFKGQILDMFIRAAICKKEEKTQKSAKNLEEFFFFKDGSSHEILTKFPEFLLKIRPLLVFLGLLNEIFKRVHSRFEGENILKSLEEDLNKNCDLMIRTFDEISNIYRNEITKIQSLEEFCVVLGFVQKENSIEKLVEILKSY